MKRVAMLIGAWLVAASAHASLIVETYNAGVPSPTLGGFTMTDFPDDPRPQGSLASSVDSPISGTVDFVYWDQSQADLTVETVPWWQYAHGPVYTTHVSWIELILPADTRAFSFSVGASFHGRAWFLAFDDQNNSAYEAFSVAPGNTPGFGIYSDDACSSITRIIVDPVSWGVGNFGINQDSCTSVSEPGSAGILALGVLAIGLTRRRTQALRRARSA